MSVRSWPGLPLLTSALNFPSPACSKSLTLTLHTRPYSPILHCRKTLQVPSLLQLRVPAFREIKLHKSYTPSFIYTAASLSSSRQSPPISYPSLFHPGFPATLSSFSISARANTVLSWHQGKGKGKGKEKGKLQSESSLCSSFGVGVAAAVGDAREVVSEGTLPGANAPEVRSRSKCQVSTAMGETADADTNTGFFQDVSDLIAENPPRLHYGVCAADVDADGQLEFFVCGFGSENLLLKWTGARLENVARGTPLADPSRQAIGVAAGDIDGDGVEEVYVLNTDTFGGRKRFTDRLFDKQDSRYVDLLSLPQNMDDANVCAGRSVCAVDRRGDGRYGFFVANYGGHMKLLELGEEGFLGDVAGKAGLRTYPTGGRSLLALPLVSHASMDIFVGNEGGPNFLFVNKGGASGEFAEAAAAYGLMDANRHCRGVAVVDMEGAEDLGLACGNWEGPHRLFAKAGPGPRGGASSLGFQDVAEDAGGYVDVAPPEMAQPSRIRTVISADFDNDGREELFFNNIGQPNRLFRQNGHGGWEEMDIGAAAEPRGLGTGAAVADIDGDGRLELLV